jgi:hypothetical protein
MVGYSGGVRLRLLIAGRELPLRQVAHDRIILNGNSIPVELVLDTRAEVVITVDGNIRRWPIQLATPVSGGRAVNGSRIISLLP